MNNGTVAIFSYNYGAKKLDRVFGTLRLSLIVAVCVTLTVTLLYELIPNTLLGLFSASDHMRSIGVHALRITVLSRGFARPFFEDLAPNIGFMEADLKREYRGIKGLNALYRRLTAKQFTAVADLHSVLRSEYLRMRFNMGRYRVAHIDKHRKELESKDIEAFYKRWDKLGAEAYAGLLDFCRDKGLEPGDGELAACAPLLQTRLKALLARAALGTTGYWQVINREEDPAFQAAMEVIRKWPEVLTSAR